MTQTEMMVSDTAVVTKDLDDASTTSTSRVFVSGLPRKCTSEQLRQHFAAQFKVTDAHVIADRRIGFVGFADSTAAQDAAKHFDRSYIRMSRIVVDLAKPVQVSKDKSGNAIPMSQKRGKRVQANESRKRKRSQEDDGETLRSTAAPAVTPASEPKANAQPASEEDLDSQIHPETPAATDMDWMRGRTSRTLDLQAPDEARIHQDEDFEQPPPPQDTDPADESKSNEKDDVPSVLIPNARLFLRNLAFSVTEDDLLRHFGEFGKIQEIHLVKDKRSAASRGTAYVQFAEPHDAQTAFEKTNGITFQGRLLHVLPAADKRDKGLTEYEISQMPLKKQKAIRRKLDAARQSFSWNSMYMNPDAVLSSIADRLGVDKADILDPTSSDAAVKQAHAETQLIKETKQFLAAAGVNIDAFKNKARDDRCLLLKNFSYGTTEAELLALLESFGSLAKFIMPPAGTMALAQYMEAFSAAEALKNLAYKNINGSMLYLEKAPKGIFDTVTEKQEIKPEPAPPIPANGTTTTVFVKNLNFSTTTARLQEIARSLPGFVSARVKTRTDEKHAAQVLSMGFGFVEFRSKPEAESAVAALAGHQLDGHQLVVQLSSRTTDAGEDVRKSDQQRKKTADQTKIIIKNLPFQATKKDIRSLFAQYGTLKTVRVPKKFDNTTRGFAFAEFVTPKEAENAMDALSNTHLLGRRLVLQFAEGDVVDPEEEIKAIEKKVEQQSKRVHFNNLKGPGRKKFNLENARDIKLDA